MFAQDASPLTLEALVQSARENDLRVREAAAELDRLRALHREASWAWFPRFETTAGLAGPMPEMRNDGLGAPPTDPSQLRYTGVWGAPGVMVRLESTAFLPVFTFGKLGALEDAARSGVQVGEALRERARDEAGLQAAQAYFGYQLARQGRATLEDTLGRLTDAETLIKELLAQESAQVTQMDTYKLAFFRKQVEARLAQVESGRALALTAVRLLVGAPPEAQVAVAQEDLASPELELAAFETYLEAAYQSRPELRAVRAGLAARAQEVFIHERLFLPDVGVAGYFRWMYTTSVTRQRNPFAYDPYNDLSGGVALVARQTFDFPVKSAKLAQARAQLRKLEVQKEQLQAGIRLEVQKAHGDLREALSRARALEDAERQARRWATAAYASFELGTADTRELTDAFTALAAASAEKIKAWHDAQLGSWTLSRVVGSDVRSLGASGARPPPASAE